MSFVQESGAKAILAVRGADAPVSPAKVSSLFRRSPARSEPEKAAPEDRGRQEVDG
jgi:hypothetical protein